jgi:hypothetical protein
MTHEVEPEGRWCQQIHGAVPMCNSTCLSVSAMKPERVLRGLTEFLGRAGQAEAGGEDQTIP